MAYIKVTTPSPSSRAWAENNDRAMTIAFAITLAASVLDKNKASNLDRGFDAMVLEDMAFSMSNLLAEALQYPQGLDGVATAMNVKE